MADIERLWPGETVAILATGPSLTSADVAAVRGRVHVIVINDAYLLAPWSDVLFSADRQWWRVRRPVFAGMKVGIGSMVGKHNQIRECPDVRVLRNDGYVGLCLDSSGLRTGKNSGYSAIGLAVHLGAARILLCGYNCGILNGRQHCDGVPPGVRQESYLYPTFRRAFETLAAPLQEHGVEVLNCTPGSSLNAFPMADLRDVLASREVAA